MNITQPLALLGGMSPEQFMKRHWEKKPLLVRQAIPGFSALLERSELFELVQGDEVESRLISQADRRGKPGWQFRSGPFPRRALPPLKQPNWTLLLQGMDLHHAGVHQLMQQFRFVPDARLDDVMISYATDGGGVGPHFDSYDVFLLQAHGQRRWRYGRQKDMSLVPGMPLKILSNFVPEFDEVLNPGDMLYLPPRYAHDGIAVGECMTYSIGFRSPNRGELARELLQRLAEDASDLAGEAIYRDPQQAAVPTPGAIPAALHDFAHDSVRVAMQDPDAFACVMGEYLTEPKANVWFEGGSARSDFGSLVLDRRSRMMYDARHIFINGEGFRASGRDAALMHKLADERRLDGALLRGASADARTLLLSWLEAGWIHEPD